MKKAFTLVEIIFVIVIIAFLSAATFKALQSILLREFKAKLITRTSIELQNSVDIISSHLKYRVPYSVIGYDPESGKYEQISELTSSKPVLEWIETSSELFLKGDYSDFLDMATKNGDTINSPDTNGSLIVNDIKKKFNTTKDAFSYKLVNLIFAGSFDRGYGSTNDYKDTFGWHGGNSYDSFDISIDDEGNITITDSTKPKYIYEKYFLVDSAYAIAKGEDIDQDANCIKSLNIKNKDINNTMFLFYDYRPWKGETFCADKQGNSKEGNVSVLMQHISGFRFDEKGYTIRLSLDANISIRGGGNVHLSKMKVVF